MSTVDVDQISEKASGSLRSRFLPNNNFMDYPLLAMEEVCMVPGGTLLLVNLSEEEVNQNVSSIRELGYIWQDIYSWCGNKSAETCTGVIYADKVPENASWIAGNTLHFLPYVGNSMHNFAERVWPNLAAHVHPFNETTPKPIHHCILHRFHQWMREASQNDDRKQLLWQARLLFEVSKGADFLLMENQTTTVCFERFLLQMHSSDRFDETRLPSQIYAPAIQLYRKAIFNFFGMPIPQVRLPPQRLRVLYYGRSDTSRRKPTNNDEVLAYLRNISRPQLQVFYLDELLASGNTSYNFPDVMSIYSQTDIFVVAHGANTWATFCLPDGAGFVEIFGPCNWSHYNYSDTRIMHTWTHPTSVALGLKHDISNPFRDPVPNEKRGNTTLCKDPYQGVPDYTIDTDRVGKIIQSFGFPDRPGDRMTLHWLHDWQKKNS
ncbi:hypothetical protein O6H91_06G078800 [Diphasiastrum complanatum]|nr:hypothetical protein O6H91_06G078800 [Diphasiastrum complanatum]